MFTIDLGNGEKFKIDMTDLEERIEKNTSDQIQAIDDEIMLELKNTRKRLLKLDYGELNNASRAIFKEQVQLHLRCAIMNEPLFRKIAEHEISPAGKTADEIAEDYLKLMKQLIIDE
jgi:hypothetical protein